MGEASPGCIVLRARIRFPWLASIPAALGYGFMFLFTQFGPVLAALVVTWYSNASVREWARKIVRWRVAPRWLACERAKRDARSSLEGQANLMPGEGAKTLEPHLVLGWPHAAIVWLADEFEAGLVVVGSRGHGRMRALVGSVSD